MPRNIELKTTKAERVLKVKDLRERKEMHSQ